MIIRITLIFFIIKRIKCYTQINKEKPNYLKFPFNTKIKEISKSDFSSTFDETNFINNLLINPIFLNISIGTPPNNIQIMLDQNEICSIFDKQENLFSNNEINSNNNIVSYTHIVPYNIKNSKSSKILANSHEIEDAFYLYQYTSKNLELNNTIESSTFLRFLYRNDKSNELMFGKIGLNANNLKDDSCPKFFKSLKNQNIINKNIYLFDFYSRFHGFFYLGPEPHFYNIKNNINKEYQYVKMKTVISKENNFQWDLLFNKIFVKNKTNNHRFNLKNKYVKIDFNLGLIIGTDEYQKIIDENFFNLLINMSICKKSLVNYSFNELNQTTYYVYSCNRRVHQRTRGSKYFPSYFDMFPEFEFFHIDLQYTIKIYKHELFEEINDIYYFLIVFEGDKKNNIWKLGQPFLKRLRLIFDYDSKTIGYYDVNIYKSTRKSNKRIKTVVETKINNTTNKEYKNNENNENNEESKENKDFNYMKTFIKYFIEIILICIIIVIAFYAGMKIKESRRKRANELKDDDFEYLSHNSKNINKINGNKSSQNIELNKMGL